MKISSIALLDVLLGALSGCSSDVDKCVDAQVTGWKANRARWDPERFKTETDVRAIAHFMCLQVQSKK
jgi:hypothetical protein